MWRVFNYNGIQVQLKRWFQLQKRCLSTRSVANLTAGDSASIARTFTIEDIRRFAEITGDCNPIHIDADFAKGTKFGRCVVHGALINGTCDVTRGSKDTTKTTAQAQYLTNLGCDVTQRLVSAVMGTRLPGPGTVVAHQYLEFPNPLYVNEAVEAKVEVTLVKRKLVECSFCCTAIERNMVVMKGYVKLLRLADGSSIKQNTPEYS